MLHGHAFAMCRLSLNFGPESREECSEAISLRRAGRCIRRGDVDGMERRPTASFATISRDISSARVTPQRIWH